MIQASLEARKAKRDIVNGTKTVIYIPGTRRTVKVGALKDYTIGKISDLWLESDIAVTEGASDTMSQYVGALYRNIKQCVLVVLNSWWKINLFYKPMVFLWTKVYGYTQEQIAPILAESKKKLMTTLESYWINTVFLLDMRTDLMKMTKKEAEQYRAELLLAANRNLSQSSKNTAKQDDSSSVLSRSGLGDIDANLPTLK